MPFPHNLSQDHETKETVDPDNNAFLVNKILTRRLKIDVSTCARLLQQQELLTMISPITHEFVISDSGEWSIIGTIRDLHMIQQALSLD